MSSVYAKYSCLISQYTVSLFKLSSQTLVGTPSAYSGLDFKKI